MYLTDNTDIESPQTKAGERTLINISRDVETLVRVIKMTGQNETLIHIFYSTGGNKTLGDIVESTGDFNTLNGIIELIDVREDPNLLNSGQTFVQDELDTSLIFSCLQGYTFIVEFLICLGADLQTRDKIGNTPLLICAENGFTNISKLLILRQADINAANNWGNTALILAAGRSGSVEMVKLLLAQPGINVNHQNREGNTALMKATEAMDVQIIKLLLDSHKNAAEVLEGIKNCRHETAQNIADRLGLGKVVKLLAEAECEPILAAVRACDVDSFSVLINCQLYDSSKMCSVISDTFQEIIGKYQKRNEKLNASEQIIIQRLVEYTVKMTYYHSPVFTDTRLSSYKVPKLLMESLAHSYLYLCSKKRVHLLKIAAEYGLIDLFKLWLKFSFAPHLCYFHVKCAIKNGQMDCARFLVKNVKLDLISAFESRVRSHSDLKCMKFLIENFPTEVKQFAHTKDMNELLVSASKYGNTEMIGLLLEVGANVNCVSECGSTPLMKSKCAEVIYFLVQRGTIVNENSGTEQCFSPALIYHLAHKYQNNDPETNTQIVEALLKCGAHVNGRNSAGNTPLMVALSKRESKNIVQLLLDYGADYNMTNSKGITILSLAVTANKTDNILCLLQFSKYSKDILNFKTFHQPAALIVAAKRGNFEVVKHLVDHGANAGITDESGNTIFSFFSRIHYANTKGLSCIRYLLDQGAYVSPEVVHNLILRRNIEWIPKLIQCGLSPSEMSRFCKRHHRIDYPGIVSVSPVCVALMINSASLARYFIANLFLTKSDTCRLASNQGLRHYLQIRQASECLCVLDELSAQPMSLFTLAFVAVQTAVGSTQGRQERISNLPLPQLVKDRLLFKQETVRLDKASTGPPFFAHFGPSFYI